MLYETQNCEIRNYAWFANFFWLILIFGIKSKILSLKTVSLMSITLYKTDINALKMFTNIKSSIYIPQIFVSQQHFKLQIWCHMEISSRFFNYFLNQICIASLGSIVLFVSFCCNLSSRYSHVSYSYYC